jgi:hypothetical protein
LNFIFHNRRSWKGETQDLGPLKAHCCRDSRPTPIHGSRPKILFYLFWKNKYKIISLSKLPKVSSGSQEVGARKLLFPFKKKKKKRGVGPLLHSAISHPIKVHEVLNTVKLCSFFFFFFFLKKKQKTSLHFVFDPVNSLIFFLWWVVSFQTKQNTRSFDAK